VAVFLTVSVHVPLADTARAAFRCSMFSVARRLRRGDWNALGRIKSWLRTRPAFPYFRRRRSGQSGEPICSADGSPNSPRLHRARLRLSRPVCQHLSNCGNFATAAVQGSLPPTARVTRFALFSSFPAARIRDVGGGVARLALCPAGQPGGPRMTGWRVSHESAGTWIAQRSKVCLQAQITWHCSVLQRQASLQS
jgi:hypothetical protein